MINSRDKKLNVLFQWVFGNKTYIWLLTDLRIKGSGDMLVCPENMPPKAHVLRVSPELGTQCMEVVQPQERSSSPRSLGRPGRQPQGLCFSLFYSRVLALRWVVSLLHTLPPGCSCFSTDPKQWKPTAHKWKPPKPWTKVTLFFL